MRTKTLVLTALSSLSAFGLMAQTSTNVYSLNAVGYINVTCPPGFSIIADQLYSSDGSNTVGNLLNDANGQYDGVTIYKWNGSGFLIDTGDSQLAGTPTGYDQNGVSTLNPGEAAWLHNPFPTNLVLTFVGTVPQGTNTVQLSPGFNLVSSPVPQSGDLVTVMGLSNYNNGDTVYVYSNSGVASSSGFNIYTVDEGLGGAGNNGDWDPPGDPLVSVGQGFWYHTLTASTWTRNFSVNQ